MESGLKKFLKGWGLLLSFALLKLLIELLVYARYGIHRDEFMYFEMGNHLAWGFLETPPFIAVLAWLSQHIFGYSEFAMRFFPAVSGSLIVFITGVIVKKADGKHFAQVIAMTGVLCAPIFLRVDHFFMPVTFNFLFWTITAYFFVCYLKEKSYKYLIWTGVAIGIGMLVKHTMFLWALSLFTGIAISEQRSLLKKFAPYTTFIAGAVIFMPNFIWQWLHNFPVIHHITELNASQLVHVTAFHFIMDQLINAAPVLIFWLAGLIFLLFSKDGKTYRPVGWAYITVISLFILFNGKSYYAGGAYPVLFAFGGIYAEKLIKKLWIKVAIPVLTIVLFIPALPFALPILPLSGMLYYSDRMNQIGFDALNRWEDGQVYQLPQDYADMLGWKELAKIVTYTYQALPEEEKKTCAIYAEMYGSAGAVDFYGNQYYLPKTVCLNSNYYLWANDSLDAETVIFIGGNLTNVENFFGQVEVAGRITHPFAREKGLTVYLCRLPKTRLRDAWQEAFNEKIEFR